MRPAARIEVSRNSVVEGRNRQLLDFVDCSVKHCNVSLHYIRN